MKTGEEKACKQTDLRSCPFLSNSWIRFCIFLSSLQFCCFVPFFIFSSTGGVINHSKYPRITRPVPLTALCECSVKRDAFECNKKNKKWRMNGLNEAVTAAEFSGLSMNILQNGHLLQLLGETS